MPTPYITAYHQQEGFLVEFSVQDPNTEEIWWRIKPKASELRYAGRLGGRGGLENASPQMFQRTF
ncbi:uncharacterized protein PADG_11409 [Paracoccidioides brasiliensis Pb18]|uniref:Uncharacterized protein n=1 Tax=Paracoccidioides brasiliensis (strain Pb18) TaxID=502780 RepID=A0A0A0HW00_PARBD|nr:uncharacterized protein PADG_11409 [Paracoccidioides brasiliensis Pb18]KGM92578.1 hypothetical protein PADG_11409 [Paracoccidioides brasiliensis Pb18]